MIYFENACQSSIWRLYLFLSLSDLTVYFRPGGKIIEQPQGAHSLL